MDFPGYEMNIDEIENESYDEEDGCHNENNVCDTCEREFQTYQQYQKHMSEHKTCNLDGCTFTAHEKIIEKHVKMQHSSGLYNKIKNLDTPEDISKWIAERKKKFPSKENIEKRYRQQEEMLKRGEKLTRNPNRFDMRNKSRFTFTQRDRRQLPNNKKFIPRRKLSRQKKTHTVSLLGDKSDWNGNLMPFRGTSQLYEEESVEEVVDHFDDSEWTENVIEIKPSSSKIVLDNALGTLMSAYNSSDESDVDSTVIKIEDVKNENSINDTTQAVGKVLAYISDDEAPLEQKVARVEVINGINENVQTTEILNKDNDKYKRKRKRMKKRSESNSQQNDCEATTSVTEQPRNKFNKQNTDFNRLFKKRKTTLLERLLENEIVHERNVLLQCVRFIVANKFFNKPNNKEVINVPEGGQNLS